MDSRPRTLSFRTFDALARLVLNRPWLWVVLWVVLLAIALPGSMKVRGVLQGANGGMKESEAIEAQRLLNTEFDFPFSLNFQVVLESQKYSVDDPQMKQAVEALRRAVLKEPDTRAVQTVYDTAEPALMRSDDGRKTFILVGQQPAKLEDLQKRTLPIREALKPVIAQLQTQDPSLQVFQTGMNAVIKDVDIATSRSTGEAERRVLLLTLILLLLAFGSITGALLPGLIAVFATVIGLGLIYEVALRTVVTVYAQSISTMIGLAVGIDYALLIVWRLREELSRGLELREALRTTIIQAGKSVFFAGLTFIIGLAGLFFAGLTTMFSIGLGGVTVVVLSMLLSLTLLPALILLLGKWLEFPRFLSQRLKRVRPSQLWEPLAMKIMRRPVPVALAATGLCMLLSAPALTLDIGQFDLWSLPQRLESRQGFDRLGQMSVSGVMVPMLMVVKTTDGSDILTPERLEKLRQMQVELGKDPIIARVYGIAGSGDAQSGAALYNQLPFLRMAFPQLFSQFLSRDQSMTLVQVIPRRIEDNDPQVDFVDRMRRTLPAKLAPAGLQVLIGGPAAITLEYNIASFKHMPAIMVGVIVVTWLFLFWALRSYLIAFKAVILNLCSVGISYGIITLVFQYGLFPGVAKSSIMAYVPLLLFCIIFGMSIDYEVFLMARIREEHDAGYDNETATARGIRATGDVITYAALIMCIVFGAFTMVEISIIKQLGFGLATAILVDATLIRMILVPAFMKIGGKWNWYPGSKSARAERPPILSE